MRGDAVVIGAGVIGLAVARELASTGRSVIVLERHARPGTETSSRNSEVIHAGMYYAPGSLKARLTAAGNPALYAWCEAHHVPHRRVGKFIVATTPDEEAELELLLARGRANGVHGLRHAAAGQLARDEPDVTATAALWSPETGIVDTHALVRSLEADALGHGCALACGHTFLGAEAAGSGYRLRAADPNGSEVTLDVRTVVNCAGLEADAVAGSMGINLDEAGYRQTFVKGSYFRLAEGSGLRVRHLVYPVPHRGLAGLGVHVTVDLAGGVRLGPDVQFLEHRMPDYHVDPDGAQRFAAAARRYLPGVRAADLRPDQSGIRPRRVTRGDAAPDFVIAEESARGLRGWINLVGMESPGLTCCLAIAQRTRELLG